MAEPFATSVASNLVSKLCEYLFAPIGRQFGYVLCYTRNVDDLKNEVEKLKAVKEERVQPSVDKAMRNGKLIHTKIKKWLDEVEKKANEAQNLLKQGESANNACFRERLPNPMVRHPIGRKVKKMTQIIRELHDEIENNNFQKVYYENPPKGIVSVDKKRNPKGDVLESRGLITDNVMKTLITEDVMKAILDDKICVVGVYGPGGVGKSKLLEDVERRVKKEKLFDVVAMAEVSRNPNIKTIQGDIADALGLKLMNVETAPGRADRLRERFACDRERKILIILDNLQSKLELKDVGIPCGDDNKIIGCKLLLSSRNREVLRIGMFSDQDFRLNELDDGEARRLFERITGDMVYDSKFKPFVDGVVKNCGGLPPFIISLAKRLRSGKLAAWRNALILEGSDFKSLVEQNYNDLQDKRIKSLFLIYAISDRRILLRDALIYCFGLGLFNNFNKTIEDARDRLIMDLDFLQDSSLLLDSDVTEEIRMHDTIADVAISTASLEWNALVGREDCGFEKWSKDELKKCTMISFPQVGIDELPEKLDCPNLRMFLLYENNSSLKIPQSFFESMEKLQVLDLSCLTITSIPSSIQFLKNLKSLCLDFCHLEDVTDLGKLKALQFLSLVKSTIARLPKEIGELTELRFLDLTRCTRLKDIEPGVLESLINLEELYMKDSFGQWEAEDEESRSKASLTELKNMNKLRTLDIAIPHSSYLSRDLPFGKLNKYKIQIGGVWDWSGQYKESRTLKLKLDSGNLLLEDWVQRCLQRTQDLHLDELQDGNDSIHNLCVKGFQQLKNLHVQNSASFQCILPFTDNVHCTIFTTLESLFLKNLQNLEYIFRGYLGRKSLYKLKIVKMDNCGKIKHLFPWSMMKKFLRLEEIEISRCHLMKYIIVDAEVDEDGDEIDDDPKMKLCNLHRLALRNLPEITSFCKTTDHSIDFFDGQQLIKLQNLEAITIERCPLIRELFKLEGLTTSGEVKILMRLRELTLSDLPSLGRIWSKNPRRTLCFQNLRALKVQNCEKLRFLFSSSMAKALLQIKEIEIASCKSMEEIIDVQEEELEEARASDTIEFPLLTSLSLEELGNLKTFSYGKYYIHCPSLTRLTISQCPKMITFTSFKGRQQSITANIDSQQAFGYINSASSLPGFFNEKVLFPSLEKLKLSSICQLKRIWHNQLHEQSFCKLASLTVELCENLSHVFPSYLMDRLQSLNKIKVVGCPSLETLFEPVCLSSEKRQKPLELFALKKMKLLYLPRLTEILKSDCKVTLAFPNLMEVNVRCCHILSHLFSSATAITLHKLEVLDVSCCNNLRGIIAMEEGKEKTVETFKFHHLTKLKLGNLKSLICFSLESCAGNGLYPLFDDKLAFPKLEELHVKGVEQKELWNDKILVESFCHLKVLKVKQCHNLIYVIPSSMWKRQLHCMESLTIEKCQHLRNLFTISMAKSLRQLQYLSLNGCGEMEYIVAKEEEEFEEVVDKIVIPQLVTLYLHNMPKLRSFYQGKHILEWPSLKEFTVEDCKAVKAILGDAICGKLEGGVPTHQPLLLVKKVEFPRMESMKISHMDNMEKIWLDDLDSNAFGKLKTLVVEHCEKLLSIFSSYNMLTRFQNLEKITVTDCGSLEVAFQVQEFEFSEACSTNSFRLGEIVLTRLPKMKHVWNGLPRGGLAFGHLQCMKVVECESLKSLFPSLVAKSMTQFKELLVQDCGVEDIIMEDDGVGMSAGNLFFPQLIDLTLLKLPKLRSFCWNSHTSAWPLLKQLQVRHCNKMRSFSFACESQSCQGTITSENQSALFSFEKVIPHLEELTLSSEDVAMMPQHYVFHNLKELNLACYHNENVAFPSNFLLHRFPNLEELDVICSFFEEIFPKDSSGHGGATPCGELTNMEKPLEALRNLRRLELRKLCNLKRVWKYGSLMTEILKQIEVMLVEECPRLPIVLPSPISFQRLTHLGVKDCNGLVHMGTCSAVTSLVHLTWLCLRNCVAMEAVVTDDGNVVGDINFPKLEKLILDGLPSLESFSNTNRVLRFPSSFSNTNRVLRFPSLVCIVVTKCPKMNIFCKGALRTPKLDEVLLSEEDDEGHWEGDLNTTIQTLSALNDPQQIY